MYCVLNTVTAAVLFTGSRTACEVYIEKYLLKGYYKIMKVLEVEGETIPYNEEDNTESFRL